MKVARLSRPVKQKPHRTRIASRCDAVNYVPLLPGRKRPGYPRPSLRDEKAELLHPFIRLFISFLSIAFSLRPATFSTNHKRFISFEFALNALGQNPRLQLKTALIRRFILEDRMLNLGLLAFFILHQKLLSCFRR